MPIHLARDREQGILRRMSTTPVPPAWMLAAQVTINLALAVLALGVMMLAGTTLFGLAAPKQAAGFALALVLTIAAMFAIGLWISAIARTAGRRKRHRATDPVSLPVLLGPVLPPAKHATGAPADQ